MSEFEKSCGPEVSGSVRTDGIRSVDLCGVTMIVITVLTREVDTVGVVRIGAEECPRKVELTEARREDGSIEWCVDQWANIGVLLAKSC